MSLSLRTPPATAITVIKAIVFFLCLLPAVNLALGWQADALGANPIETITRASGEWTLRFLLITLAVTPLRRLTGLHWRARLPASEGNGSPSAALAAGGRQGFEQA